MSSGAGSAPRRTASAWRSRPGGRSWRSGSAVQRPDLEAVLEFYDVVYNPNKSGEQTVRCAVHEEKNPSMRLNLGSGLMFCNSCDFRGSSVDLIMAKEGISA